MNSQKQTNARSRHLRPEQNSQELSRFALPVIAAVLAIFGFLSLLQPKPSGQSAYQLNLKELELSDPKGIQTKNVAATEAPRYGLRDLEVRHEPRVNLILWDNGWEDGDFVTVMVNGQVYANNFMLRNSGNTVAVALNPGANLVEIFGNRDGGGGITLAAATSNQGNITDTPFPEGASAKFYIFSR